MAGGVDRLVINLRFRTRKYGRLEIDWKSIRGNLYFIFFKILLLDMNSASPLSSSFVASHRRPELVVGPVGGSSASGSSSAAAAAAAGSAPGSNNNNNLPNYREQAALQQQILQVSSATIGPSPFKKKKSK